MHDLFVKPFSTTLLSSNKDYLRIKDRAPKCQIQIIDEIERLGIEQLLQSRGAEIVDSNEDSVDEITNNISPAADVLILANTFNNRPDFSLNETLDTLSTNVPNLPILVICGSFDETRTQQKLATLSNPLSLLVRGNRIESEPLLTAVRKITIGDTQNEIEPISEWESIRWISAAAHSITRLTNREHEVLNQVASGLSNKQIATRIGLSVGTVNNHLRSIFSKLDLDDKENINVRVSAALAYCVYNGIVTTSPRMLAQMADQTNQSAA